MDTAGRIEPRWIGDEARRLYAALHPATGAATGLGLLVVPPLLHEQPRSRRLLTQLATRISAFGIACLRFDYFGSGDSEGSGERMDLASMRQDIGVAADALRSTPGVERIAILAVRGGALPLASWLPGGGDVDRVVLWEPIVDGAGWVAELEDADARELRSTDRYPLRRGVPVESSERQLMGFDVSPRLRGDLAGIQVSADAWPRGAVAWGVLRQGVSLPSLPMQKVFELPSDAARIGDSTRMDGALFVSPALQELVDALARDLSDTLARGPALKESIA